MKILVPVDGSPASLNAVKKAIEIAKKQESSIKLINVIDDGTLSSHNRNKKLWRLVDGSILGARVELDEVAEELKANAEATLDVFVAGLDFSGIKVEKKIVLGTPYVKILETAADDEADLIVIGNRGFSKIKSFFLGSVAQRVIAEAKCPVLVVHADAEEE